MKRNAQTPPPTILEDTWRYVPVAVKFSILQKMMVAEAGFNLFDKTYFPDQMAKWSRMIDVGVDNEVFSLLFLVHDNPKSPTFSDWLHKHCDRQNCLYWSFLGFAWKSLFNKAIGRYVTSIVTANWKKVVSDVYHHGNVIEWAATTFVGSMTQRMVCHS